MTVLCRCGNPCHLVWHSVRASYLLKNKSRMPARRPLRSMRKKHYLMREKRNKRFQLKPNLQN